MQDLKFYHLCFSIVAAVSSSPASAGASFSPATPGEARPSLRQDPEFELTKVPEQYLAYAQGYSIFRKPFTFDECRAEAISEGAQAFEHASSSLRCIVMKLFHPICRKFEGHYYAYIREDYYTDGSPSDNASWSPYMENYYSVYRIESPTILDFQEYVTKTDFYDEVDTTILPSTGGIAKIDSSILTDPSCYSNSACSIVFLTSSPEIPANELLVLHDICGQTVQVDSGKNFYVLSHEGIGCKYFPNDYPVADCWAEFTGAGEIKINVTFVNFRESDQCDGFTMTALTYDASGSSDSTDLCVATAPTELTSAGGKVRIEFGGGSGAARQKYGFIIRVTAA